MPDTGAAGVSTAGLNQFYALQKVQPAHLDNVTSQIHKIKFGKGSATSIGTI